MNLSFPTTATRIITFKTPNLFRPPIINLLFLHRNVSDVSRSSINWKTVIGLEIHAQFNSKHKLFSGALNTTEAPPNSSVSFFDGALPGSLPIINWDCIKKGISAAIALNCKVNSICSFDRKHYFYSDLPSGFQITQHYEPIGSNGELWLTHLDGLSKEKLIRIKQIQIEQDTARSHHDMCPEKVAIDLNRAGAGLLEIVTEPDIETPEEATLVLKKIQGLLRAANVSNCQMEEGSMRCDVNVSVHKQGQPFGIRCEIKNLNSLRQVKLALEYEIRRHIQLLKNQKDIKQETRQYDVQSNVTFRLRSKEETHDYRYIPEPDIPRIEISKEYIANVLSSMPELPDALRIRLMKHYKLSLHDANVLLEEPFGVNYYEEVCAGKYTPRAIHWVTTELLGKLRAQHKTLISCNVKPKQMRSIVDLVEKGVISGKIGKEILNLMVEGSQYLAEDIAKEKGWSVMNDEARLVDLCNYLIENNPDKVNKILKGRERVLGWFVGQVLKETKGQANPELVTQIFRNKLGI